MLTNNNRYVLFSNKSKHANSGNFICGDGYGVLVVSFNLPQTHSNPPDGMPTSTPFTLTLSRSVYDDGSIPGIDADLLGNLNEDQPLGTILSSVGTHHNGLIVNTDVMRDGCPVTLTACNPEMLVVTPGCYRLEMNDENAKGEIFVFGNIIKLSDIAPQMSIPII